MASISTGRRSQAGPTSGSQLRRGFLALLNPQAATEVDSRCNPLCVITPGGQSPLLAEFADWAADCGCTVLARGGRELGREIATALAADSWDRLRLRFAAATVVVIEHLEKLGSRSRLTAFRHLFDAATAANTRFCISLGNHPLSGQFDPDLAGRLAGGLVLRLANDETSRPASSGSLDPNQRPSHTGFAQPRPSLARVLAATARHHGLSVDSLIGPSRSRTVSQARSLAMYLARQLTQRSFAEIGRVCGGRDHTTALHGNRIAAARIAADPVVAADAATILAALTEFPKPDGRLRTMSMDCQ